jgi:hypothetical protein
MTVFYNDWGSANDRGATMITKTSLKATDCRQHAAVCESEASRTGDPITRDLFVYFADQWRRIENTFAYFEEKRRNS